MLGQIGTMEQVVRYGIGTTLIAAVLLGAQTPPWLALFGTYPIFTAMAHGDPFYAVRTHLQRKLGRLGAHPVQAYLSR